MLPKLDVPVYEITLPSNKKKIRFRPFLVKEQKLFMMASQSEDPKESLATIRQVLSNCIIDDVDVNALPTFDLEYLFMNLRARSVEEVVEMRYKCNNTTIDEETKEEKKCNGVFQYEINLTKIEPTFNPTHSNKIALTEKMGVVLKYPTFEMAEKYDGMPENEVLINVLMDCIEYIYDEENLYYAKDNTREELEEFIDSLQQKDLEKFKEFFDTMPEVKTYVPFKCPKCAYEEQMEIKGLQNFFV
jgi:hypothetical protein